MRHIKVYEQYDKISDWFDKHRTKELIEKEYLNLITTHIPQNASLLDLGCGTGEPIAQFFIKKGYKVTGVDGSFKMIDICKKRFPKERWILADMREINFSEKFDLILAWHSFFHLPQFDQRAMFKVISAHLQANGIFAFTSGYEPGEIWSNNGGENLYHASLSTKEYEELLSLNNFQVLVHNIEDPECGGATVWVVQKSAD